MPKAKYGTMLNMNIAILNTREDLFIYNGEHFLKITPERIFSPPNFTYFHFFVLELIASLKRKETDLVQLEKQNVNVF